jgi:hypothetical protein
VVLSRRAVIKAGIAGTIAWSAPVRLLGLAGGSAAWAAPVGAVAGTADLRALTMATFVPHVSSPFLFHLGAGHTTSMPLFQVVNHLTGTTKPAPAPHGESFSLVFRGPNPAFPQGTYLVDHAQLGRLQLFVVPVERRTNGQDYQAVFNRTTA